MSAQETRGRGPLGAALVGFCLMALAFVAFPAWPDDWDGLGFLASVTRFDMASFAPHPPGYPVYVALLKAAALVSLDGNGAARLVAGVSLAVSFAATFGALSAWGDERTGPLEHALGALFVCGGPLAFHALSGVGSEGPAMAFAALAVRGLSLEGKPRRQSRLVGLAVGLGLGVRLSWAPFFLPFLLFVPRPVRLRAVGVALLATLAWLVPLVVVTGPSTLVSLFRTHLGGHLSHWGGTVATDPVRVRFLLRDILIDGFGGDGDLVGLATLVLLFALLALVALAALSHRRAALIVSVVTIPYLAWIALGQNLREQPRHALPVVLALSFAVALVAGRARLRPLRPLFWALLPLVLLRTGRDAYDRHEVPPPGEQLVMLVRQRATPPRWIITGQTSRFFDGTPWQARTIPAASIGEAILALTRKDDPLGTALVTSEVSGVSDDSTLPKERVATLCRPARLDRRTPCLNVYAVASKALLLR